MCHEIGFLQAILEEPDDDTHRLVYADWLEEQDDTGRAEFIRMQCARSRLPQEDPRRLEMYRREEAFLLAHADQWLEPLRLRVGVWNFRRGFLESATLPASAFLLHHRLLFRISTLWHLRLEPGSQTEPSSGFKGADEVARLLASSPLLLRLDSLAFPPGDLGDAGTSILAASAAAAGLTNLDLAQNAIGPPGARALAQGPNLSRLTWLSLDGNPVGDAGAEELLRAPWQRVGGLRVRGCGLGESMLQALRNRFQNVYS